MRRKPSNEIGPGVCDIHSPRVPSEVEMTELLIKATKNLAPDQIWVNPDCSLKTRGREEVRPALINMVAAAQALREDFAGTHDKLDPTGTEATVNA
jgi:5-methyltetrahydropteroyltriglutamate--homocysteine methyltransferase